MELHIDAGLAFFFSRDLQRVHGDQQGQQHRQDQQGPKKKKTDELQYSHAF